MKIKLAVDISAHQASAKEIIDRHFNALSVQAHHRDEAHRRKRTEALHVISGANSAPSFEAEAGRGGKDVKTFAKEIMAKHDDFSAREDQRRVMIENVRAAKSVAEIQQIMKPITDGQNGNI